MIAVFDSLEKGFFLSFGFLDIFAISFSLLKIFVATYVLICFYLKSIDSFKNSKARNLTEASVLDFFRHIFTASTVA